MANQDVTVNLIAKTQKFDTGMNKANKSLRNFSATGKTATTTAKTMGSSMDKLGGKVLKMAAAYIGLQVAIRAIGGSIKVLAGFEFQMARVEALTFASKDAMAAMTAEARRLGATTMFSASQAAEGLAALGQAGFNAEQAVAALESTLNLAAAGNLELGAAADIATNVMAGFKLGAEETTRVADVLASIQAKANTNVQGMGEAMKFVAPFSAALNISMEQTSAAVGVLANAGIKAGLAGRGLSAVMGLMVNPNEEAGAAMKAVGLTLQDLNPEVVGLEGALKNLQNFDVQTLAKMFGAANVDVIMSLLNNLQGPNGLAGLTESMENSEGTAKKSADLMAGTLTGAYQEFGSAIQDLIIGTGSGGFGNFLTDMVAEATFWVRKIQEAVGMMKRVAGAGDLGAILSATFKFGAVSLLNGLVAVVSAFGGLLLHAISPVIGLLLGAFITIGDRLGTAFKIAGNFLLEKALAAALGVLNAVNKIPGINVDAMVATIKEESEDATKAKDKAVAEAKDPASTFNDNVNSMVEAIAEAGNEMIFQPEQLDTSGLKQEISDIANKNKLEPAAEAAKKEKKDGEDPNAFTPKITAEEIAAQADAKKAAEQAAKDALEMKNLQVDKDQAAGKISPEEAARRKIDIAAEARDADPKITDAEKKKGAEQDTIKKETLNIKEAARLKKEQEKDDKKAADSEKKLNESTTTDSFRSVGGGGAAFNVGAALGLQQQQGITGAISSGGASPLGAAKVGGNRQITVLQDIRSLLTQIRDKTGGGGGGGDAGGTSIQLVG